MPTLAVANLRKVDLGPAILDYLQKIDATLAPYDGRFLVHGQPITVLEEGWVGDFVVIIFPDRARAEAWYRSPAYQAILPLRTGNSDSTTFLVDTVPETYRATDFLKTLGVG
ncbi:DUF1330 domain-containing protein [Plastoroseomonas hellenica]|uniref:DUF1330 domain-containing protein n=1 Tax=Plastoroseomonas hellenica TaxID=2687306 RepID=UPI001BA85CF2|nr:DUF1330 domain-containing protein [Plastoroseomonas hellenica]MBR0643020.1 DUF1330 domain-containing protein [Plastoroseomonas hellenica]